MAQNRRRFGDRKEGRLVRSLPGFAKFIPFIMPQRNDRFIHYEESFEITALDRRLRQLRVGGFKGIGILHFIIAAYIRCISMLPGVNRFVAGRRIYARDDIEVVMTVKRSISLEATETTIKVHFEPTDTIFDVYRKMNEKIDEIKTTEDNNNTEDIADAFARMPRFLIRLVLAFLRMLDYFGWLPQPILEASPFHGSMIITDLGSLRIGPVYHHIYNFGTLPVFIAFGAKYHKYEINPSWFWTKGSWTGTITPSFCRPSATCSSTRRSWRRPPPASMRISSDPVSDQKRNGEFKNEFSVPFYFRSAHRTRSSPMRYTLPAPTVRMMSPGRAVSRSASSSVSKLG